MNISDITNSFQNDLLDIKKIIRHNLKDRNNDITLLMDNLPAEEGKLIRALFVLIGASFGNIEKQRLFEISAAVELFHFATLIHDDIVDDSSVRRKKTTIHEKYNIKTGLFAGDYLFAHAYIIFSKNCSSKSIYNVSETIKCICKSEINQYFSLNNFDCTLKDYLRRINGKCASLFSLSLSIGAKEANANTYTINNLKKIGHYAGMAFQMIDDLLDISSSSAILGKPSGNDIKQGIFNLPIIYELKKGNTELFNYLNNKQITEAVLLLRNSDSYTKSKKLAEAYTLKALELVDRLPENCERNFLKELLIGLFNRNY